jgi:riboflavin biosynthesis pyrimidine reductase
MSTSSTDAPSRSGAEPEIFDRLMPPGGRLSAAEHVREMGFWERPALAQGRVRVILNMVSTIDGRASLQGRSGPISSQPDRELFHALRLAVDAVLVGAGTVRAERYGRIIRQASDRELRVERGLTQEPLACVVSGRLDLDASVPLLADPEARVAMLTSSAESLPPVPAHVDYVREPGVDGVDLARALAVVHERFSVHTVLCEGGPHLARRLFADGILDELLLSLAPVAAGGEPAAGHGLRILAGAELEPPADLELRGVVRAGSHLFLRYGVCAPDRVSRATTASSSLAS